MDTRLEKLSDTFNRFFNSEKSSGLLLIACTLASLFIANSAVGADYLDIWRSRLGPLSIEHWINDGLMAIFFLLIGLELERELYVGELSNLKNALLPLVAAIGGMVSPALVHFSLNAGSATQSGFGIPMATDIAFSIGVLALLGKRIPAALKVFVVAFAVIDDLGAIIIIATAYTDNFSPGYLLGALVVWALLGAMNKYFGILLLTPYLLGGALMWVLMLKSGVHATIAGVMLAFAIPFTARDGRQKSPSHRLEHFLHKPVAFLILPLFALANTGVTIAADWGQQLTSANSLGIALGLIVGKPVGVTILCLLAVLSGICRLPADVRWTHIIGAGMLGGIGFTMSIFIANLAFSTSPETINASKVAILLSSLAAGAIGYLWLMAFTKPE